MWQEGMTFCEAMKEFSQVVATEEEATTEALEDVKNGGGEEAPTPAPPLKHKGRIKKR